MNRRVRILQSFDAPGRGPAGLAWDGVNLWHADYGEGRIFCLASDTAAVRRALYCPGNLSGLTWDGQALWQALFDQETLRPLNPTTNDFDEAIILEGQGWLSGVAWDGQNLWVVAQQHGRLLVIDRAANRPQSSITVPLGTGDIDYYDGLLWVSSAAPLHYDAALGRFEWAAGDHQFAILGIDPVSGEEKERFTADHLYAGLCWVGDTLWLAHSAGRRLYRAQLV